MDTSGHIISPTKDNVISATAFYVSFGDPLLASKTMGDYEAFFVVILKANLFISLHRLPPIRPSHKS